MNNFESLEAKIIQNAFVRVRKSNSLLSVRAIAKKLNLSPSHLSKVFRGLRPISESILPGISKCLQLDHHESSELARLIAQRQLSPLHIHLEKKKSSIVAEYLSLSSSEYWLLEKWYYLPALALLGTKSCGVQGASSLAERLGISESMARDTIDRLAKEKYIRVTKNSIKATNKRIRFPTERSHPSVRGHHRAMLERAISLLSRVPSEQEFSERLISGITFAGNPKYLPEAKVVIEEALYRAAEILARDNCTEVYQLNLQLFAHGK